MTPAQALAAIERVRDGAVELLTLDEPDAITAVLETMQADLAALEAIDAGDEPDEAWGEVGAAFEALQAWLSEPAEDEKAALTREQRINLAVRIATRGRGASRGRDAADVILDGFYGGLGAALRGAGTVIAATARLAGRATLAAGEALGRGINAGAVHVDAYIRDGKPVAAHERSKSAPPGAYLLYR
tara:strand:- start:5576 stop:6136 length:561 start_codon:yes stop_codon:yes gene_type:complete